MLVSQDINKLRFHSPTYTEGEDLTWKQYTMHIWHNSTACILHVLKAWL